MARQARMLAAALFVGIVAALASGETVCTTTPSTWAGVQWRAEFALFNTESMWQRHGAPTRLEILYDSSAGCVRGVRAAYGSATKLLGSDALPSTPGTLASSELILSEGETVIQAAANSGSCISYLSLRSSSGKVLAVGDAGTPGSMLTLEPPQAGGYLAALKVFTDELGSNTLQRLQLIWAAPSCPLQPDADALRVGSVPEVMGGTEHTPADVSLSVGPVACRGNAACRDGTCPTSSCTLSGMGKDVLSMLCFGTNLVPNPLLDLTTGNHCANLACKLDRPNCTSIGVLGVGGFCTGKVVAMGAAAKLHPSGKALLGHPCIENKGPVIDLMPLADYTARGVYAAKAWKVCDCVKGGGFANASLSVRVPNLGSAIKMLPRFPFLAKPLANMSLPDVLAQWVAANQADAELPQLSVHAAALAELRSLLPNITLPSLVVPKISAPLLKLPANFSLPVFTLSGNHSLARVSSLLPNMTSLPTLMLAAGAKAARVPRLRMPEVSIPNLNDLAITFGVPALPKVPSLPRLSFQDIISQWQAAMEFDMPLPRLHVSNATRAALEAIVPGLKMPCLLVLNMSSPLLRLPNPFPVPVVTVSDATALSRISALLPKLSALPSFLLPTEGEGAGRKLPQLSVPNVTVPNWQDVAGRFGASVRKTLRVPALGGLLNMTMPQLELELPEVRLPELTFTQSLPDVQIDWASVKDVIAVVNAVKDYLAKSAAAAGDAAATAVSAKVGGGATTPVAVAASSAPQAISMAAPAPAATDKPSVLAGAPAAVAAPKETPVAVAAVLTPAPAAAVKPLVTGVEAPKSAAAGAEAAQPAPDAAKAAAEAATPAPEVTEPAAEAAEPAPAAPSPVAAAEPATEATSPAVEAAEPALTAVDPASESKEPVAGATELIEAVAKPAPEAVKPATEAAEPAPDAVKPATEGAEPAPEAVKPATEAAEPAPEAAEPAPEAVEPAPEAAEPAPEAAEPAPPAAQPTTEAPKPSSTAGEVAKEAVEPAQKATEPAEPAANSEPAAPSTTSASVDTATEVTAVEAVESVSADGAEATVAVEEVVASGTADKPAIVEEAVETVTTPPAGPAAATPAPAPAVATPTPPEAAGGAILESGQPQQLDVPWKVVDSPHDVAALVPEFDLAAHLAAVAESAGLVLEAGQHRDVPVDTSMDVAAVVEEFAL